MDTPVRKIIHIDMDAFYASVEQRDDPELKGKPVAVGGDHPRGVVAAASYEARKFGVRSAMPSVTARKLCPGLVFVSPRFDVYHRVSDQIFQIYKEYTELIEPLSLDEAFLDVTENKKDIASATIIAKELKQVIKERTLLTASAGVSVNKFLAKIASDYNKPDGLFVIKPEDAETFVEKLQVEKFFGVGKVTAKKMHQMGINTGLDLKKYERHELVNIFGKTGSFYYDIARGIDTRPVDPERIRKSLGAELTFDYDLVTMPEVLRKLLEIERILVDRVHKSEFSGRTLTLKVKYEDFEQITRSKSLQHLFDEQMIHNISIELAGTLAPLKKGIRLLGIYLSNTRESKTPVQLSLNFKQDDYLQYE